MFDREYDLRMHIRHHHCAFVPGDHPKIVVGTAKSFVCQVCGVQFKTGHKLRNHELVHSGAKPFVCESCGKRFRFRNNLYQHKLTHLNERKHKCPLCTKIFKRLAGLNQVYLRYANNFCFLNRYLVARFLARPRVSLQNQAT